MRENKGLGGLVIDDYDLSVGRVDSDESSTSSRSLLNHCLMNMADNPFEVQNASNKKVALSNPPMIVITVNDSTRIYEALKRVGRANIFEWVPDITDMHEMVSGLYPKCDQAQITTLINSFPDKPITFFEQMGLLCTDKILEHVLSEKPISCIGNMQTTDMHHLAPILSEASNGANYEMLSQAGKEIAEAEISKNYLTKHHIQKAG